MTVELPRRMGPFLLLRHLASGGMGEVYLAHQSLNNGVVERLCVVKTVRPEYAESGLALRRFLDEARTTALLSHKNVAAVLDVGEADGPVNSLGATAYIAVEHVAGRDLHAVFQRSRRLKMPVPEEVALYVMSELLDALAYVHRATDPRTGAPLNIVHRDISPHNVMVSFEGDVKLIDFGVARSAVKSDVTQTGQAVGKIRYMSPEQARAEKVVDGATDVYGACIVCVELLTGRRFYGEMSMETLWLRIAGGEPHEPQGFSKLPADLQRLLRLGLEPDRTLRPSASELKERMRALQVKRGTLGSSDALRAYLAVLFEGQQEEERRAYAQLMEEPTSMNAARLPSATVMEEGYADDDGMLEVLPDAPTDSQLDTGALAAVAMMKADAARLREAREARRDQELDAMINEEFEPISRSGSPLPLPETETDTPTVPATWSSKQGRSNPRMKVVRSKSSGRADDVATVERTPHTGAGIQAPGSATGGATGLGAGTSTGMRRRKKQRQIFAMAAGIAMPIVLVFVVVSTVIAYGKQPEPIPVAIDRPVFDPLPPAPPSPESVSPSSEPISVPTDPAVPGGETRIVTNGSVTQVITTVPPPEESAAAPTSATSSTSSTSSSAATKKVVKKRPPKEARDNVQREREREPRERPKLLGDRVRALRSCSPKPACAAPVLARSNDMAALSAEEFKAFDEDVDWCLSQCR